MPFIGSRSQAQAHFSQTVVQHAEKVRTVISEDFTFADGTDLASAGYPPGDIVLECMVFPTAGHKRDAMRGRFLSRKSSGIEQFTSQSFGKPTANRLHFAKELTDSQWNDEDLTVDHRCHNPVCVNPEHLCMSSLAINKGRNGCAGGKFCKHLVKCLRPGPFI